MHAFFEIKIINLMAIPVLFNNGTVCGVLLFINKRKPYKVVMGNAMWFSQGDELIAHLGSYLFSTMVTQDHMQRVLLVEKEAVKNLLDCVDAFLL